MQDLFSLDRKRKIKPKSHTSMQYISFVIIIIQTYYVRFKVNMSGMLAAYDCTVQEDWSR